jgi:hypothetical protein
VPVLLVVAIVLALLTLRAEKGTAVAVA